MNELMNELIIDNQLSHASWFGVFVNLFPI